MPNRRISPLAPSLLAIALSLAGPAAADFKATGALQRVDTRLSACLAALDSGNVLSSKTQQEETQLLVFFQDRLYSIVIDERRVECQTYAVRRR